MPRSQSGVTHDEVQVMQVHSDEFWYEQLLDTDPAAKQLNHAEKSDIIRNCMQEAARQLSCIEEEYGAHRPEEYLERLGFTIVHDTPELMPTFLYMGMMYPGSKTVALNETVIALGESRLQNRLSSDDPMRTQFRPIILFHELYHVWEESHPQVYTRNCTVTDRWLGLLTRQQRIEAASEIGAIHFSKLASGVSFNPYLYTQLLLAAVNRNVEIENEFWNG